MICTRRPQGFDSCLTVHEELLSVSVNLFQQNIVAAILVQPALLEKLLYNCTNGLIGKVSRRLKLHLSKNSETAKASRQGEETVQVRS